jgi:hypothetical protein
MDERNEFETGQRADRQDEEPIPVEDWQRAGWAAKGMVLRFGRFLFKRRWWGIAAVLVLAAAVAADRTYMWVTAPKFSRSECLVRIDVEIPSLANKNQRKKMVERKTRAFLQYADKYDLPLVFSFGAYTEDLVKLSAHEFYLFGENCDTKFDMVQAMVDAYVKRYPNELNLVVSRDVVDPNRTGFDVREPIWTDTQDGRPSWKNLYGLMDRY